MTTQTEITQRNHRRAVRFFWCLLVSATTVSLIGNIAHAVLPYIPRIVVQVGAAAVPPTALLAAVHGIAVAVRAGASGRVYYWAVSATGLIGFGAFAVSFLALRDLMRAIGYSAATAWVFPAIIDTAVAVATVMLVALGDKPARRSSTASRSSQTQTPVVRRLARTWQRRVQEARSHRLRPPDGGTRDTSGADADLCIGTTRFGANSAEVSANRRRRCRNCTVMQALRQN